MKKRILCIVLCLVALLQLFTLSIFAENLEVDLVYIQDCYSKPISSSVPEWIIGGGTETTGSYPAGTYAFAKVFDFFDYGYTYRVEVGMRFSGSSLGDYSTTEFLDFLHANVYLFDSDDYSGYGDPTSAVSKATEFPDQIRTSTYLYHGGGARDIVAIYIVSFDDQLLAEHYYPCLGISGWNNIQNTATVTYTRFTAEATRNVDEAVFYQQNIDALNDIESAVQSSGQATVNAVQADGQATRSTIDAAKAQAHADAEQAHADAQQAHEDAENAPQHEKDYIDENKGDTDDISIPDLPVDDANSFISDVFSTLSTTTKQSYITLPSAHVPFLDIDLWDEQVIDFSVWLSDSRITILIGWWIGLFSIGAVFAIIWGVYSLVMTALGLRRPSAPDNELTEFMYTDRGDGHYNNGKPISKYHN